MLPVGDGAPDEDFMQRAVENTSYWKLVKEAFSTAPTSDEAGDEDQADAGVAMARLAEIKDAPHAVLRGNALDKKLKRWAS